MSDADIIFVVADWSLLCSAGKTFSGRHLWRKVLEDRMLWPGESCKPTVWSSRTPARCGGPPKAISLQYPACPPWVDNNRTAYVPSDVLVLTEYRSKGNTHMVTPFVVSGALAADPQSPAGRRIQAMQMPWASRKLALFAGHVPALHNSEDRYRIWRQLRRDVRATTKSHTINCSVGQYAVCRRPIKWLREQPNSFFINACKPSCGAGAQCGASEHRTPAQNLLQLQRKCKFHRTATLRQRRQTLHEIWHCVGMTANTSATRCSTASVSSCVGTSPRPPRSPSFSLWAPQGGACPSLCSTFHTPPRSRHKPPCRTRLHRGCPSTAGSNTATSHILSQPRRRGQTWRRCCGCSNLSAPPRRKKSWQLCGSCEACLASETTRLQRALLPQTTYLPRCVHVQRCARREATSPISPSTVATGSTLARCNPNPTAW